MKSHPYAELFPMMEDTDLQDLVDDLKKYGLRQHIVTHEGMILDGRNRFRACKLANINPTFTPYKGSDPLAYVLSCNLRRRHLTTSQRAMVAASLATLTKGEKKDDRSNDLSQTDAAAALRVSVPSVKRARKMLAMATPSEIKAVKAGKKTVSEVLDAHNPKPAESSESENMVELDKMGYPIPDEVVPDWKRAETCKETVLQLHAIKRGLAKALEAEDVCFAEIQNVDLATIKGFIVSFERVLPYAVCPSCQGFQRKSCTLCKRRGWISEFLWNHAISSDVREMRKKEIAQ